ncbi:MULTISPECIES: hypothetical protein [unclassified Pseudoalteromonas]|uniref:hypothetical protein n=1 Tax=unclassified Pseudoalteromonas TaxID=194690 RepID=UPI00075098EA|nr:MULTISPECIES: hypothetical protein [unclassified Pseudoalteromonas]
MKQDKSMFFKRNETLPFIEMRQANLSSACYHSHSYDYLPFSDILNSSNIAYQQFSPRIRLKSISFDTKLQTNLWFIPPCLSIR